MMKKLFFVFFLLMGNATISLFSEVPNMVNVLWGNNPKPILTKLDYTESENELRIALTDDMEIIIHLGEQIIEITKSGASLFSFESPRLIAHGIYLGGAYQIQMRPYDLHTILLVVETFGSGGMTGNMSFGILIDTEKRNYQSMSTWGNVSEHFVDVDDDGSFEFVCVDVDGSAWDVENIKLIANIFSQDSSGFYTVNDSLAEDNVFVLFFDDHRIEEVNWRKTGFWLLKTPDLFKQNNRTNGTD